MKIFFLSMDRMGWSQFHTRMNTSGLFLHEDRTGWFQVFIRMNTSGLFLYEACTGWFKVRIRTNASGLFSYKDQTGRFKVRTRMNTSGLFSHRDPYPWIILWTLHTSLAKNLSQTLSHSLLQFPLKNHESKDFLRQSLMDFLYKRHKKPSKKLKFSI